jgi:CP family cyanate transporter-like MFS transporter
MTVVHMLSSVSNCAFSPTLSLIGMRFRASPGVMRLSTFVQSAGYLMAVPGRDRAMEG